MTINISLCVHFTVERKMQVIKYVRWKMEHKQWKMCCNQHTEEQRRSTIHTVMYRHNLRIWNDAKEGGNRAEMKSWKWEEDGKYENGKEMEWRHEAKIEDGFSSWLPSPDHVWNLLLTPGGVQSPVKWSNKEINDKLDGEMKEMKWKRKRKRIDGENISHIENIWNSIVV